MEVVIHVNKQMGGYTFGLTGRSERALKSTFGVIPSPNIFVAYDVKKNFEQYHGPIARHIIPFMLGLDGSKLSEVTVKLVNVRTKEEMLTQHYD